MNIIITGSSGLVGQALIPALKAEGHRIIPLVHKKTPSQQGASSWDYRSRTIDTQCLEGSDAVIHLAGENIAHRWTQKIKDEIRHSRVDGTTFLCQTLASLQKPPQTLLCASAIGFYGNRGDLPLTETSPSGTGFLAESCTQWEKSTELASDKGIRVANLRFGMILSSSGGALTKLLTPFKMGMGGVLGDGKQYMSWIGIDDVVGAILHALKTPSLAGPVNVTTPNPVTNREFTETLGHVLSRPTSIPLPAFAARMMFGEMADELLLASTRVVPEKLLASGYQFRYPTLEECLRHLLSNGA